MPSMDNDRFTIEGKNGKPQAPAQLRFAGSEPLEIGAELLAPPKMVLSAKSVNVHFSSKSDDWSTPQGLFDELSWIFGGFTLDPCATTENAKCARFFTREQDGLGQEWTGKVFVNPPYGRAIGAWVRKAFEASCNGALVVCLLPARTDTSWWQDYCRHGHVYFLRGRLKFGKATNCAPFPSAIVTFGKFFSL